LSPFSAPVMQMGFEAYLNLLLDGYRARVFEKLMAVNEDFCVRWGNAQLEAGATAIVYFDPLASTDMVPLDLYEKTGFEIAKRIMSGICGPTATHLASARTGKAFDLIARTGTAAIGFSGQDDLNELKKMSTGRLALIGNLNGVAMRGWDSHKAESEVKKVLDICAPGGGFILSDSHGEIPWSVPEEVLYSISEAAISWKYPEPEGR
ncbi:MAG: uroporphyrinogen decarboxylase family protein, partial [Thermovirgaceae bacterium]|nr:uroporphyrinogen decarboxylase family protein [Thermovirgaceae bacterium]